MKLSDVTFLMPFRSDYGHREMIMRWNLKRLSWLFPTSPVVVSDSDLNKPFNLSQARNKAFCSVTTKYVAFIDSDTVFDSSVVHHAVEYLESGLATWLIPYRNYNILSPQCTTNLLKGRPNLSLDFEQLEKDLVLSDPPSNPDHAPPVSGLVMMSVNNFSEVGGFDERFVGWGFEDWAFRIAADRILGDGDRLDGNIYHLWHPVAPGTTNDSPTYKENQAHYNRYFTEFDQVRSRWVP